ncbi:hypothetical protein DQ238_01275 [Geodermatophilus sp. TF02-6]|uniref:hypothetical protein n=1 Tax=Geodermatophilus sp. TF02-6 TaxID=2250575 RepID=UPI000DE98FCE|nr:hypothetical protein [Geodermatophilus sp. TF02-6]RBY83738.1 hypothetical protein DQ238_01275 [Geodermatophilus sp. TF02-6]
MTAPDAADLLALLGDVVDGHVLDGADARTLVVLPRPVYDVIARRVDVERTRAAERAGGR